MKRISYIALCILWFQPIHPTRFLVGNDTFPNTFTRQVLSKVFDPYLGILYFGLASGAATFNISAARRNIKTSPWKAIPLATTTERSGKPVGALALAAADGQPALTIAGTGILGAEATDSIYVFAISNDGTKEVHSATLLDASGLINENGQPVRSILALAANQFFIFAFVRPNGLGDEDTGVAVVRINYDQGCPKKLSSLVQTAAVAGDAGIKAKKLDKSTIELFDPVEQPFSNFSAGLLYWDDPLQRLYIAEKIIESGIYEGDTIRSVVVGRIYQDTTGILELSPIAPTSAITANTAADQDEIVVGKLSEDGTSIDLQVFHLGVMHASTGPSYLIVNGGNDTDHANYIFALPLVDLREPDGDIDPADAAVHGTLAKKDSPLVDHKFVVPATAPGDLVQDPTISPSPENNFALVGGTPLPLHQATGEPLDPFDMIVIDDTVYVAIDIPASDFNETGILYSQAKFGPDGKIIGWTPWAKRGFPIDGLPNQSNPEVTQFVAVDAVTGDVWAVGGDDIRTVAVTEWDKGQRPEQLATNLNRVLSCGTFSVLDLDAYTRGFDENTIHRYALFGGIGKVVFTRISFNKNNATNPQPQFVIQDFREPENFLVSLLPKAAGTVTSLEYSRNDEDLSNYFFAGTEQGLFVFEQNTHGGFDASSLAELDQSPFTTGGWVKAPIAGAVIDLKTLGNRLYILSFSTSPSHPLQSTLYSMGYASTTAGMFADINVIAESNFGIFSGIHLFNGIQLIGTSDDSSTEQLILATNQGLFYSSTLTGVQTAADQLDAAWQPIPESQGIYYNDIAGMDPSYIFNSVDFISGFPSTIWPISVRDLRTCKTFNRGSVQQLNGTQDYDQEPVFEFVPENFNGNPGLNGNTLSPANFHTLLPVSYFFSDGARRFYIVQQNQNPPTLNNLMVSPYNAFTWGVTDPAQNILFDPMLLTCPTFNWVKQIGMSGVLLAGTNSGVLALE